jgi:hypothetical protein
MSYYPLSQLKTNLYTDGTEYETSNGVPYKGFYYKTSTGKFFTGKTPQDLPSSELFIQLINEPEESIQSKSKFRVTEALPLNNVDPQINPDYLENIGIYNEYLSINPTFQNSYLPYYSATTPTTQDYQIGEFRRYFCKKTNEIQYIEINKTQYDLLFTRNLDILWQLYSPFYIPWQLTGDKEQVARTNFNIVQLTSQRLQLPKFGDYLNNNYIKYYK